MPQDIASIAMAWSRSITAVNAVICVIVAVILYLSLYKSFRAIFKE